MSQSHPRRVVLPNSTTPAEQQIVDELMSRSVSRRQFVRGATAAGVSFGALSAFLAACGSGSSTPGSSTGTSTGGGTPRRGGRLRASLPMPLSTDPTVISEATGTALLLMASSTLTFANLKPAGLEPMLATRWASNRDATVWTFKLRRGVRFSDGSPMTAEDVVYTLDLHTDPAVGSPALSALGGVLSKGGTKAVDAHTVRFTLDKPNGNFPYLVSSENYNVVVLPKGLDPRQWERQRMVGTGPFRLVSFDARDGFVFERNPHYWGGDVPLDGVEGKFYGDDQAQVVALLGGEVDLVPRLPFDQITTVEGKSGLELDPTPAAILRVVHMRVDSETFGDKRVRQAIALALDRPAICDGFYRRLAALGNDSPFAPVYASTDRSVAQRQRDLARARELLDAAGKAGMSVTLTAPRDLEVPQYAQVLQDQIREIGVDVRLDVSDFNAYYGDGKYGSSPWLDSDFGIMTFGHRSVPNVVLETSYTSKGAWNASHYRDAEMDRLVAEYVAQPELARQQEVAGQIQTKLLDDTPVMISAFIDNVAATRSNVRGVNIGGGGQMFLDRAWIEA